MNFVTKLPFVLPVALGALAAVQLRTCMELEGNINLVLSSQAHCVNNGVARHAMCFFHFRGGSLRLSLVSCYKLGKSIYKLQTDVPVPEVKSFPRTNLPLTCESPQLPYKPKTIIGLSKRQTKLHELRKRLQISIPI